MNDVDLRISMSCDLASKIDFEAFQNNNTKQVKSSRYVNLQNLDGNTAAWVVIATLSAQVIPHFLNFISNILKERRIEKIKIGDMEINHPSQEDIELFRQAVRHRLNTSAKHDNDPPAR